MYIVNLSFNNKEVQKVQIGKHEFILESDKDGIIASIEELRDKYEREKYGYVEYMGFDLDKKITEKEYDENLNLFIKELERRLEPEYVEEIIKNAKKKKNGTFHKGRVYDRYVLKNATFYNGRNDSFSIYEIRYSVYDDLRIVLSLNYSNEFMSTDEYLDRL